MNSKTITNISQKFTLNPGLLATLEILKLNILDLRKRIAKELLENPALEEVSIYIEPKTETADGLKAVKVQESLFSEEIDWSDYIEEYNNAPDPISFALENNEPFSIESFEATKPSLKDHLLWQILTSSFNQEQENIGCQIAGNLNQDGYVDISLREIAASLGTDYEKVLEVLIKMQQTFDPPGVCSRSLSECLKNQLKHFGIKDPLVEKVIAKHLKSLQTKDYEKIADALKVPLDQVKDAAKMIKMLDPRPGRQFISDGPNYITPDIYIYLNRGEPLFKLNDEGLPKLRINRGCIKLIKGASKKEKEYIKEKIKSAFYLIKGLTLRRILINKIMEAVLKFQKDYFLKGASFLLPMLLSDIADDTSLNESTVSRVATNKYVHTHYGVVELKALFNRPPSHSGPKDPVFTVWIKNKMFELIQKEDPLNPLTDNEIAEFFINMDFNVARRTITKYREKMGIKPSYKRKAKLKR